MSKKLSGKNIVEIALQLLVIFAIGALAIWLTSFLEKEKTDEEIQTEQTRIIEEVIREVIVKRPTCVNTSSAYGDLRSKGQIVTLTKGQNTFGQNGSFVNKQLSIVQSSGSGSQIACGYLFARASVGAEPVNTDWVNLYIKPGQFGGHIETAPAITIKEIGGKTEFLYNLNNIQYRTALSESEIKTADWASLLNVSNYVEFELALNTDIPAGVLDEVSIVYKCWNPETGKETNDCKLQLVE